MNYPKKSVKNSSIPISLLISIGTAWFITTIMSAAITTLVISNRITENWVNILSVVTLIIATLISSYVVIKQVGKGHEILCFANGAIYYISLLCCNALFFDGKYQSLLGTAFTVMGTTICTFLLEMRKTAHKKSRFKTFRKP